MDFVHEGHFQFYLLYPWTIHCQHLQLFLGDVTGVKSVQHLFRRTLFMEPACAIEDEFCRLALFFHDKVLLGTGNFGSS